MFLNYQYKLITTEKQKQSFFILLEEQRVLYNAALEERISYYSHVRKSRSYFDQCKALTEWRQSDVEAASYPLNLQRWTLKRVDDAFQAFFRRLKLNNEKTGFPRFRSKNRWNSFGFAEFSGIRFKKNKIYLAGNQHGIRVHMHRNLPSEYSIKSCVFTKKSNGWYISFQIKVPDQKPRQQIKSPIGIDVGITHLATLSDGTHIKNTKPTKKYEIEIRVAQRSLARKKKKSKGRRKALLIVSRLHQNIRNMRNTYLHQTSRSLIDKYDLIAVEKLQIKNMAQGHLAKSIHDAAWAKLIQQLSYKAEWAGTHLVVVNAKNTSQICSECGVSVKKDLSIRVHECTHCGLILDRDVNSALNILCRAVVSPEVAKRDPVG